MSIVGIIHNLYLKKRQDLVTFCFISKCSKRKLWRFPSLIYQTDLAPSIFSLYAYSSLIKPAPEHGFQVLENSSIAAKSETLTACLCNPKTAVIGLISEKCGQKNGVICGFLVSVLYLKAKEDNKKKSVHVSSEKPWRFFFLCVTQTC